MVIGLAVGVVSFVLCIDTHNFIYFIVDFVDARGGPERLSVFSIHFSGLRSAAG